MLQRTAVLIMAGQSSRLIQLCLADSNPWRKQDHEGQGVPSGDTLRACDERSCKENHLQKDCGKRMLLDVEIYPSSKCADLFPGFSLWRGVPPTEHEENATLWPLNHLTASSYILKNPLLHVVCHSSLGNGLFHPRWTLRRNRKLILHPWYPETLGTQRAWRAADTP